MISYLYFLFVIICINLLILYNINFISKLVNIYDYPDDIRKLHQKKIPLIGWVFVAINLILFLVYFLFFKETNYIIKESFVSKRAIYSLYLGSLGFLLLGLFDDKYNLRPEYRLFILSTIIIYSMLIDSNLVISTLKFRSFDTFIFLQNLNLMFTLICFLSLNVALNMYDGINLQFGIYICSVLIILILKNIFIYLIFPVLLGFFFYLYLNSKSIIFFGNAGVNIISFFLSFILIHSYNKSSTLYVDEILIIFIIPALDFLRLFLERAFSGKNPMLGDRNHIHHHLQKYTKSTNSINILLFLLSFLPFVFLSLFSFNSLYIIVITVIFYSLLMFFIKKKNMRL
jgi:UDP-GlcNAc:undecaprenyl-phosphate GlcNAc-1-phosphate transferase